jgi:leucyl-tRNA synthetase
VRNVTRLFERIQDFEKRVVKRRGPQLCRADAEALVDALVLLTRVLAPFAPHIAEALLIEAGREDDVELLGSWPQLVEALS